MLWYKYSQYKYHNITMWKKFNIPMGYKAFTEDKGQKILTAIHLETLGMTKFMSRALNH